MEIKERFRNLKVSILKTEEGYSLPDIIDGQMSVFSAESCASITKEVAVKFAEWLAENNWRYSTQLEKWYIWGAGKPENHQSTSDLFSIAQREGVFLNEKI